MDQYNYGWLADSRAGLASAADSSKSVIATREDLNADWIGKSTNQMLGAANLMAEPSRAEAFNNNLMNIQGEKQKALDAEKEQFASRVLLNDSKKDLIDIESYDTFGDSYDNAVMNITDRVRAMGFANPEHAMAALAAPNSAGNSQIMKLRDNPKLVADLMGLQQIHRKQDKIDAGDLDTKDLMTLTEAMRSRSPHTFGVHGAEAYVNNKLLLNQDSMAKVKDTLTSNSEIQKYQNPMYDEILPSGGTTRDRSDIMAATPNVMNTSMRTEFNSSTQSNEPTNPAIPTLANNELPYTNSTPEEITKTFGIKGDPSLPSFNYADGLFGQKQFEKIVSDPSLKDYEKQVKLLEAAISDKSGLGFFKEYAPLKEAFINIIGNKPENMTKENIDKVINVSGIDRKKLGSVPEELNKLGAYFAVSNNAQNQLTIAEIDQHMAGTYKQDKEGRAGTQQSAKKWNTLVHTAKDKLGTVKANVMNFIEPAAIMAEALGAGQNSQDFLNRFAKAVQEHIPDGQLDSGSGLHSNINDLVKDIMVDMELDSTGSIDNPYSTGPHDKSINNRDLIRNIILAGLINGSFNKQGKFIPSGTVFTGLDSKSPSYDNKKLQRMLGILKYGDRALSRDEIGYWLLNNELKKAAK